MFFFSPLEQFEILPVISLYLPGFDFSITNETVSFVLFFSFFYFSFYSSVKSNDLTLYLIPHRWQYVLEVLYKTVLSIILENLGELRGQKFFPLLFTIFIFILGLNSIGLVPYTFTLTSHLIVTLALSLALFIGINIVCISLHSFNFFSLFFPSGSSVVLGLLLVPIEVISYIFKPISLSVRLFANMMAGHTLLKVIVGFAWNLMACSGILFLISVFPLIILLPLFGLELGVALIQGFVFTILICIYLNDSINLH